jgi:hypothetical protein
MTSVTSDQRLLLKAAFDRAPNGADAWRAWRRARDLDDVTTEQQRLFPRVYANLGADIVDARVQGVHRRAWYSNRLLLHAGLPALAALRDAGLKVAVVRESAIVLAEPASHPLDRLHATVAAPSLDDALRVLEARGWTPSLEAGFPRTNVRLLNLTDAKSRALLFVCRPARTDRFWESTQDMVFEGHSTLVAGHAHQLLDVALSLFVSAPEPDFLRVARVAAILRNGPFVQWELLAEIAAQHRCSLALLELLSTTADVIGEPMPSSCSDTLRSAVTPRERREMRYRLDPAAPARKPMLLWADYRRAAADEADGGGSLGFVEFLRRRWNAGDARQLAVHALHALRGAPRPTDVQRMG